MAYTIDPIKDWPLVEEFRNTPIGHHSPGLMRVLNTLRYDPSGDQTVLFCTTPFRQWILATLPPARSDPIVFHKERVFTSREDAEWAVFCERWKAHTQMAINSPRSVPLPENPPC